MVEEVENLLQHGNLSPALIAAIGEEGPSWKKLSLQTGGEGMDVGGLQRRYVDFASSLFEEGFLDSQYTQLQQLQDENNPDFVLEVVTLFFTDAEKILNELSKILDQQVVDFKKVDALVHQLKGSSASIGAQRVKNVCVDFRNYFLEGKREGCIVYLQQVKQEYLLVKSKLETLFRLEQQIVGAGGSVPLLL